MKRSLAILLLLGAIAGVGGYLAFRKKPPPAPLELTVLFTCDTRGRLVPCGCFSGQYGGLTRLKTVLDADGNTNSIRADVGNAIRGKEDYNLIEYKYLLQAYAAMSFDALNLGHREAQLSAEQLRMLGKESPVTLISANLIDKKSGSPLVAPYKIVNREGRKVALLGLMDSQMQNENLGAGVGLEKMEMTLERLLPELKRQSDVVILLAFTDEGSLTRLAQEFYELDMILGGRVSQPSQKLDKENRSLILYTANEGRALGRLKTRISGHGKVEAVEHEIKLLHDQIPESDVIQSMAEKYRKEVRATKLAVDDPANLQDNMVPGVKVAASYMGSQSCVTCHQTAAKVWQESGHAEAMNSLVNKNADADPNCIACHTVGFGAPSGYRRAFAGKKLVDVGCESCHGPGSLHVEQRQKQLPITFKFRPLGAGDCQKCHFGEFSRPFDWDRFWPHIQHGKEPVRSAALGKDEK